LTGRNSADGNKENLVSTPVRWLIASALSSLVLVPLGAWAQSTTPAPTTSPSPIPTAAAGPSDPCTSLLALVNRPTVTTGSCVFKRGRGDLETGYTNTVTTGTGGAVTVAYPQAFVRVGINVRNVELDITPPSVERMSVPGGTVTGPADAAYGAKWEIGYTSKMLYSVNAVATVPTGARAFTAGGSSYTGNLNASYTLSPEFGLSATLGFQSLAASAPNFAVERTGVFIPSLVLTAAVPGSAQLFGEVANFSHAGVGLPARTLYDFGFQKQFGSHWQVDLETGFAPNPAAGQRLHYLGFGISYGNV
jgi:hypothetical protein